MIYDYKNDLVRTDCKKTDLHELNDEILPMTRNSYQVNHAQPEWGSWPIPAGCFHRNLLRFIL